MPGFENRVLYCALKLVVTFEDDLGTIKLITGTAFFLRVGGEFSVVTNRHCFDLAWTDRQYKDFTVRAATLIGRFAEDQLATVVVLPQENRIRFSPNPLNDIACITKPILRHEGTGATRLDYFIDEGMAASEEDFQNALNVCDLLAFPGYPEWHDQIAQRPIMRTGTIASDPRTDYCTTKPMGNCVAYEAFSFDGSSGSPVFAEEKGFVGGKGISITGHRRAMFVGINAGHLLAPAHSHSGISYFYKSPAIIETIKVGMATESET